MAASSSSIELAQLPADLLVGVAREASREADLVGIFLGTLSQTPPWQWLENKPISLPLDFLLGLGAALRLVVWEANQIYAHRNAGLPSAMQALADVFCAYKDPHAAARAAQLPARVTALFIAEFAWTAHLELQADMVLGQLDEEAFLDALADFLWAHGPR